MQTRSGQSIKVFAAFAALSLAGFPGAVARAENPYTPAWTVQLSPSNEFHTDFIRSVNVDALGNAYIAGATGNNLDGQHPNTPGSSFVGKYDSDGNQLWIRLFGPDTANKADAVAADVRGNVFVGGNSNGDAFLSKYDSAGELKWTSVFGTQGDGYHYLGDSVYGIATDAAGNVYAAGDTSNSLSTPFITFARKYDGDGNLLWARDLDGGSALNNHSAGLDAAGNLYVLGGNLSKLDPSGNILWQSPIGLDPAGTAFPSALAVDSLGNTYVAGNANLNPNVANSADAYIAKYDTLGHLLWMHVLDSTLRDVGNSITLDPLGFVYLGGRTAGSLGTSQGADDGFLAKYDAEGNQLWLTQFGSRKFDSAYSLAAGPHGEIFSAGFISSPLVGALAYSGNGHGWLVKFVPEPSAFILGTLPVVVLLGCRLCKFAGAGTESHTTCDPRRRRLPGSTEFEEVGFTFRR